MTYSRRILHYSPDLAASPVEISDRAVSGAWFQLHRQGGCGAGELKLRDEFPDRNAIDIGDWIAFEYAEGEPWYLGRVESRTAKSPAGTAYRLEGMSVELGEVFPGGFNSLIGDQIPPHRYARTDLFPNDPDRFDETFDSVDKPSDLVRLLLAQYVAPATHIVHDPARIETPLAGTDLTSLKFNGEESARSILKDLALRAASASWGVDETGTFFFLRPPTATDVTFREGLDLLSLEETRDREFLYNRLLLTGGYVYDATANSEVTARGFFRWRGNYIQPDSRDRHGERRIRIWVPWIRTRSDSEAFAREFFRVYAEPTTRYRLETAGTTSLPKPWETQVRLLDRDGEELMTMPIESVRVQFDRTPKFTFEIGPEDPHTHWPEPDQDERWEIPGEMSPTHGGGHIDFPPLPESSEESSDGGSTYPPTDDPYTYSSLSSSTYDSESDVSETVTSESETTETDTTDSDSENSDSDESQGNSTGTWPASSWDESSFPGTDSEAGSDITFSSESGTDETAYDTSTESDDSESESTLSSDSWNSSDDPWGFSSS